MEWLGDIYIYAEIIGSDIFAFIGVVWYAVSHLGIWESAAFCTLLGAVIGFWGSRSGAKLTFALQEKRERNQRRKWMLEQIEYLLALYSGKNLTEECFSKYCFWQKDTLIWRSDYRETVGISELTYFEKKRTLEWFVLWNDINEKLKESESGFMLAQSLVNEDPKLKRNLALRYEDMLSVVARLRELTQEEENSGFVERVSAAFSRFVERLRGKSRWLIKSVAFYCNNSPKEWPAWRECDVWDRSIAEFPVIRKGYVNIASRNCHFSDTLLLENYKKPIEGAQCFYRFNDASIWEAIISSPDEGIFRAWYDTRKDLFYDQRKSDGEFVEYKTLKNAVKNLRKRKIYKRS